MGKPANKQEEKYKSSFKIILKKNYFRKP